MNGYNRISYSSTKAAIVNLSKSLALEVGQYGIRVNCICPGLIRTDLNSNLMDQPEMLVKLLPKVPMGRIGTPEDVAKVAVFLASNEADYVNGGSFAS
jgi:NAD(P)-dependent dehydrogenase (short-subunit alcohol dehydrogenase family)